ncbi:MAG TPA: CPBP family intramembrane glutamic endopeptidase [Bryobacteraceae bacterium]|nr:CPBP family intramembrane glutamic endopeptidase [Bryobacteraceae bacterium]
MQTLVLALLLAAVFGLLATGVQKPIQMWLHRGRLRIWTFPLLLTAIFGGAAALAGAFSLELTLWVLIYTLLPVLSAVLAGARGGPEVHLFDFVTILLIWLPLEFAAGGSLVPRPAQGFLHSVAYGIAILLGLVLFLGYRRMPGLKYNLPQERRDFWLPFAGFALVAPVLILLGIAIGFIPAPHLPSQSGGRMAAAAGIIFAGTAVPEEILFRSLIQNLLMQRFGRNWRILLLAGIIFGAAHLDNGPQPLPNWRYMIVATVAGWGYGAVFERGGTVLSSAALHTLVDWTKHFFF